MTGDYFPFSNLKSGDKVLLAFSGGIDSTIAAHLCKKAGLDVLAVNMCFLPEKDNRAEVQKAADSLGIKLDFLELQQDFRNDVMLQCWRVFEKGKTPNPCAICNPVFKFGKLMQYAVANGCKALVTGHYAKLENGTISRGTHRAKDQSYFLFRLTPEQRKFSCFPLGAMTKDQVRQLADQLGLPNAKAKESQDACFSPPNGTLAEMLQKEFSGKIRNGSFIHKETGRKLGLHQGIHAYTIGQRKGTGVALGTPAYVQKIDPGTCRIFLTTNEETLFADRLSVKSVVWQTADVPVSPFRALVQIRYRTPAAPAQVIPTGKESCDIIFDSPVRAITPGQAAVFYDDETLLGGGFIC